MGDALASNDATPSPDTDAALSEIKLDRLSFGSFQVTIPFQKLYSQVWLCGLVEWKVFHDIAEKAA